MLSYLEFVGFFLMKVHLICVEWTVFNCQICFIITQYDIKALVLHLRVLCVLSTLTL